MRLILLFIAFIFMTMALKVQCQEVISARAPNLAKRSTWMQSITTNVTVQLNDPIQPSLGIRLLSMTTNSAMVANLSSGEQYEMRVWGNDIETKMGIVKLNSVDAKQEAAVFRLLKGVHRVGLTYEMLPPINNNNGEQSVPGYAAQGARSPDP